MSNYTASTFISDLLQAPDKEAAKELLEIQEPEPYEIPLGSYQQGCYIDGVSLNALNMIASDTSSAAWGGSTSYGPDNVSYSVLKGLDVYFKKDAGEIYITNPIRKIIIDECFGLYGAAYSDPLAGSHLEQLTIKDCNIGANGSSIPSTGGSVVTNFTFGAYNGIVFDLIGDVTSAFGVGLHTDYDYQFSNPSYVKELNFSKLKSLVSPNVFLVSSTSNTINVYSITPHDPGIAAAIIKLNEVGYSNGTIWSGCFNITQFSSPAFSQAVTELESRNVVLVFADYISEIP